MFAFRCRQSDESNHQKVALKRDNCRLLCIVISMQFTQIECVCVCLCEKDFVHFKHSIWPSLFTHFYYLHSLLVWRLPLLLYNLFLMSWALCFWFILSFFFCMLSLSLSVLLNMVRNYKLVFCLKCGKKHQNTYTHSISIFFYNNIHKIENLFFYYVMKNIHWILSCYVYLIKLIFDHRNTHMHEYTSVSWKLFK